MGRWTPLILMAGGLAILLGTLLGINFPMDGRNAKNVEGSKTSKVLPANINVNSTSAGNPPTSVNRSSVAQSNTTNDNTTVNPANTSETTTSTTSTQTNSNNAPIRALW
ncbi:MAG: hypothetical protein QNJ47_26815 [Nostocaceae cyanobacterium]|nr:hypothetical protein [Nostocaceae cyanobacterium]